MNCMKCGRETVDNEGFWAECLAEMEKYPVRPNTVIQIPHRPASTPKKNFQWRITPEEQVAQLRKKCRRASIALLIAWLLIAILGTTVGLTVYELDVQRWLGQNYSTMETTD